MPNTRESDLSLRILAVLLGLLALIVSGGTWFYEGDEAVASDGTELEEITRHAATAERSPEDVVLHHQVRSSLLETLGWNAVAVQVDAVGGEIMLVGEVPDGRTLLMAEEVTRTVDGVDDVDNRLGVIDEDDALDRETAGAEARDALVESRIQARLIARIGAPALGLSVDSDAGVVTLEGRLENQAHAQAVLEVISVTPGVLEVVDLLEA